jgi:signal transduction histidine kinase
MRQRMSIKVKIFSYLLIFCFFLLGLLWLFQVVFLDAIYRNIKISEVKSAMSQMIKTADSNAGGIEATAQKIIDQNNIDVKVFRDGETLFNARQDVWVLNDMFEWERLYELTRHTGEYLEYPVAEGWRDKLTEGEYRQALIKGAPSWGRLREIQQDITFVKLAPIGNNEYLFVLNARITPVNSTVDTLKILLLFVTGLMILFSVVLAYFLARRVAMPIVSLNKSARELAKGNYGTFSADGYREIAELSQTLNIASKELSLVDELRRELVANISHDLRTPLTLIAGYAEAMRDLPGENTSENAQIIVDEANRLNRLVSDVLDLSKLQAGAIVMKPARFDLAKSVSDIAERLREFTRNEGYNIVFSNECVGDSEKGSFVNADENMINQVVYNLLLNALNYTGDDKTIKARLFCEKGFVTLEVSDSGKGIAESEIPLIWDRYYRTGKKHRRSVIGSGLGLSIVKSVIDMHKGEYGVTSEAGKGSTFRIRLKNT